MDNDVSPREPVTRAPEPVEQYRPGPRRPTGRSSSRDAEIPTEPMPTARAIRWRPASAPTGDGGEPAGHALFITQGALRETTRHVWTAPEQEVLGFLFGRRYICPETGTSYVVISATSQSSFVVGDPDAARGAGPAASRGTAAGAPRGTASVIPTDALDASYMEARRRRLSLVGWYHSVPFVGDGAPAPRDVGAHQANFRESWQVGLVVAPRADRPVGGFFVRGEPGAPSVFLPFHEIVDENALLPDGRKGTVVPWHNYATDDAIVRPTTVAVIRPRIGTGPMSVLLPQGHAANKSILGTRRPRGGSRSRRRRRVNWTPILYTGGGILAGLALAAAAFAFLR